MIEWSLDCDYFHNVFTLPHELNPLIYVDSKAIYKLLLEISKRVLIDVSGNSFSADRLGHEGALVYETAILTRLRLNELHALTVNCLPSRGR